MKVYIQPIKNEVVENEYNTLNYGTTETLYVWPKTTLQAYTETDKYNKEYFLIPEVDPDAVNIPEYDHYTGELLGYRTEAFIFTPRYIDNLISENGHKEVNVYDDSTSNLICKRNKQGTLDKTIDCKEGSYYIVGYWHTTGTGAFSQDAYYSAIQQKVNNSIIPGYYKTGGNSIGTQRLYCKYASFKNGSGSGSKYITPRMSEAERLRGPYHNIDPDYGHVKYISWGLVNDRLSAQGPIGTEQHMFDEDYMIYKIIHPYYGQSFVSMTVDEVIYTFRGSFILGGE